MQSLIWLLAIIKLFLRVIDVYGTEQKTNRK